MEPIKVVTLVGFDQPKYVGSVLIVTQQHEERLELIRLHMEKYRDCIRAKSVLLHVSVGGIKICNSHGTVIHMAHALKRISYATSDLQHNQFCFLAREPKGHYNHQFCHLFSTSSSHQAEELNSVVGNAFRMAYATQLKNKSSEKRSLLLKDHQDTLSSRNKIMAGKSLDSCDLHSNSGYSDRYFRQQKPNSIPGLRMFECTNSSSPNSNQSTPTSDESNSPTELNIYKKLLDKPSIMKRVPAVNIKDILRADDSFLATRPTPEGCISLHKETSNSPELKCHGRINEAFTMSNLVTSVSSSNIFTDIGNHAAKNEKTVSDKDHSNSTNKSSPITDTTCSSCTTFSQQYPYSKMVSNGTLSSKSMTTMSPSPPPMPPERADSLIKHREENELKVAPWFQAGIPREITLEVLSQEPVGSFMVRESTTKSGCYALTLRVPKVYHPRGIAHYLIIRTNRGYKIKGFTKEFSTLTALITHHSVMQELLPCPLSLSKYNPSFTKSDSNKDFEDIDSDPDYNTLADFRKMMADLNV